jgi:hypothetical protein
MSKAMESHFNKATTHGIAAAQAFGQVVVDATQAAHNAANLGMQLACSFVGTQHVAEKGLGYAMQANLTGQVLAGSTAGAVCTKAGGWLAKAAFGCATKPLVWTLAACGVTIALNPQPFVETVKSLGATVVDVAIGAYHTAAAAVELAIGAGEYAYEGAAYVTEQVLLTAGEAEAASIIGGISITEL